jgi:hypothetical protein
MSDIAQFSQTKHEPVRGERAQRLAALYCRAGVPHCPGSVGVVAVRENQELN